MPHCRAVVADDHRGVLLVSDDAQPGDVAARLRGAGLPVRWGAGRTSAGVPAMDAARLLDGVDGLEVVLDETSRQFCENRRALAEEQRRLRALLNDLRHKPRVELESAVPEIDDVGELDDHQLRNVVAMTAEGCRGLCVFDEQGTGKTVTGIYSLDVLFARDEAALALVVAPKSMVSEWPAELARFRPDVYAVSTLDGDRRRRRRTLARRHDVVVCNFEAVVSLERELTGVLRRHPGRCLLYVDESFFVKNPDARRSRALRRLREWCSRCFVLCGTPAPNAARDLVAQVDLADLGATFGHLEVPPEEPEAHEAISDALTQRGAYLRSLKQDVLPDLPGRHFDVVRVELTGQQRTAYEHALVAMLVDLRTETDASFARHLASWSARRSALLQICSDPTDLVPGFSQTPVKHVVLDELLRRFVVEGGEKVVLWSFYRTSLRALCDRYAHLGLVRYDGSVTSVEARRRAVVAFQQDPGTRVIVANPAAAGAGLTLHAARLAVYESLSNQAAHWLQSLDRVHRRGQRREVQYVALVCRDTIEEHEYRRLREKERTARELLADRVEEPHTREGMLHELLDAADAIGLSRTAAVGT